MKKSEAVRRFNEGKHYIKTRLEDIASLELNNDKELRHVLMGTVMVKISCEAAENFGKVGNYIIDGEDGAQQLKDELISTKEMIARLYNGADRQNLNMIKDICRTIISEIKEVEKWTGDNDSGGGDCLVNDFPEWKDVKDEIKALFRYPDKYQNFLRGCFLPNGDVKDIKGIVDSYNRNRIQNEKTIDKGAPTLLYFFLCEMDIISVTEDKPDEKLRTFQRYIAKLKK